MALPLQISATESPLYGSFAPTWLMPNGAYYFVGRTPWTGTPLYTHVVKATDPTLAWAVQDNAHSPTKTNSTAYVASVVVGTVIHIFQHFGDASGTLQYQQFDTATDLWTVNETIATGVTLPTSGNGLAVRSNGDVIVFYGVSSTACYYRKRTGANTWSAAVQVGAYGANMRCVLGASDRVHFFYGTQPNIYHRSLSSADALDTQATAATDGATVTYVTTAPVAIVDGATTRIRIGYLNNTNFPRLIKFDSAANPSFSVDTIDTNAASGPPSVAANTNDRTLHAIYPNTSSGGAIYYTSSAGYGGSWATPVSTGRSAPRQTAQVTTRSGVTRLSFLYSATSGDGTVYYDERLLQLRVAGTAVGVVTASGRLSSPAPIAGSAAGVGSASGVLSVPTVQAARTFSAAQAQAVSLAQPISRTFSATQSQAPALVAQARRTIAATQAQSPSLVPQVRRVLALAQSQSLALGAQARRTIAGTQSQLAGLLGQARHALAVTQAQVAGIVRQAQVAVTPTQAQAMTLAVQARRILAPTQSQALALGVQGRGTLATTQSQGVAVGRQAPGSFSLAQGQAAATINQPRRTLGVTQAHALQLAATVARTTAVQQAVATGRTAVVTRTLTATQGALAVLVAPGSTAGVFAATQDAGATALGVLARRFGATQLATVQRQASAARSFTAGQSAVPGLARTVCGGVRASQLQGASVSAGGVRVGVVSATQPTTVSLRAVAVRAHVTTQAQLPRRGVTIARTHTRTQPALATLFRRPFLTLVAWQVQATSLRVVTRLVASTAQSQLAASRGDAGKVLSIAQPARATLTRAATLTLLLTQRQGTVMRVPAKRGLITAEVVSSTLAGSLGRSDELAATVESPDELTVMVERPRLAATVGRPGELVAEAI